VHKREIWEISRSKYLRLRLKPAGVSILNLRLRSDRKRHAVAMPAGPFPLAKHHGASLDCSSIHRLDRFDCDISDGSNRSHRRGAVRSPRHRFHRRLHRYSSCRHRFLHSHRPNRCAIPGGSPPEDSSVSGILLDRRRRQARLTQNEVNTGLGLLQSAAVTAEPYVPGGTVLQAPWLMNLLHVNFGYIPIRWIITLPSKAKTNSPFWLKPSLCLVARPQCGREAISRLAVISIQ
jgi:hypothetical protein